MTEINKREIKFSQPMNSSMGKDSKVKKSTKAQELKDYKEAAAAPGMEAAGRAMVMLNKSKKVEKPDGIERDIQRILDNPKLLEQYEILFDQAIKAGIPYAEAASFATSELI